MSGLRRSKECFILKIKLSRKEVPFTLIAAQITVKKVLTKDNGLYQLATFALAEHKCPVS